MVVVVVEVVMVKVVVAEHRICHHLQLSSLRSRRCCILKPFMGMLKPSYLVMLNNNTLLDTVLHMF